MVAAAASGFAAAMFAALTVSLPWAYGGVEEWARAAAAIGLAACALGSALCILATGPSTIHAAGTLAIAPAAAILLLTESQLAGGLSGVESGRRPGTIFAAETRLALALVIALLAATLVGATALSRERTFRFLLFACLVSAAAVAFGGIAMRLTGEDRIIRGAATVGDPFARFVNRNNAAAFLQVGVACGLSLLAWKQRPRRDDHSERDAFGWRIDAATLRIATAVLLGVCLAGVVASRSRGGIAGAAVAVAAALPFLWSGRSGRWAVSLLATLVLAGGLLAWLGLSAASMERFATTSLDDVLSKGRVPHWRDAAHSMLARPWFGAGMGTYGYAYQEHSRIDYDGWYEHADNQFVELLVETGAAGAVVLAGVVALTAFSLWRGRGQAVEQTLLASLAAGQAAHAMFDFAVLVPAVLLPCAALWGSAVSRLLTGSGNAPGPAESAAESAAAGQIEAGSAASRGRFSQAGLAAAAVFAIGGLVWAQGEHRAAWQVDQFAAMTRKLDRPEEVDSKQLDHAIEQLTRALARRSDDALGHESLAELHVHRYRTSAVARLRQVDRSLAANDAWNATRLTSLHGAVNLLGQSGATAGIAGLRGDPLVKRDLIPARRHYRLAADSCARLPGVWIPLACLAFLEPGGSAGGVSELKSIPELFPSDVELLRSAGRVAWQGGDESFARRCWTRAFTVEPEEYWIYAAEILDGESPETVAALTCPADPEALLEIAANAPGGEGVELKAAVARRMTTAAGAAKGRLKERCLAASDRLSGRFSEAEARLRFLLASRSEDTAVRGELSRTLWDAGRRSEAIDEATVAIVLDDRDVALKRQLESWIRNTATGQGAGAGENLRRQGGEGSRP